MGEIAEAMLDGTLCAGCGEYLFNDGPAGFPDYCPGCGEAGESYAEWSSRMARESAARIKEAKKAKRRADSAVRDVECPYCDRVLFNHLGLQQHILAKHPKDTRDRAKAIKAGA